MDYTDSISRTFSHASGSSMSTANTSFDAKWMPETTVANQTRYKVSLKLSKEESAILQRTWKKVISSNEAQSSFTSSIFCVQFYNNLIRMMPGVEKLIPSLKHQASAFAGVINVAMSTLDDLSRMDDSLERLGRLHSRILGIDAHLFEVMGQALITTFKDRYENFGTREEECWSQLYCFLANSILQGGIDPVIQYSGTAPAEKPLNVSLFEDEDEDVYDYLDFGSAPPASPASSSRTYVPSPGRAMTPRNSVSSAHTAVNRTPPIKQRMKQPSLFNGNMANVPAGIMNSPPKNVKSHMSSPRTPTSAATSSPKKLGRRRKAGAAGGDQDCVIM